jgi:hypothetical protein
MSTRKKASMMLLKICMNNAHTPVYFESFCELHFEGEHERNCEELEEDESHAE